MLRPLPPSNVPTPSLLLPTRSFPAGKKYCMILARRFRLPSFSNDRTAVVAGQMVSYAPNADELYQLAGAYAGRILKGENPAELPVMQPSKFEMAINLRTAKAIGLGPANAPRPRR